MTQNPLRFIGYGIVQGCNDAATVEADTMDALRVAAMGQAYPVILHTIIDRSKK